MKQHFKKNKLNILLKHPQNLFHTKDLALIWSIRNTNTLYTTIQRYMKKGVLIKIQKGFYSKVPLEQLDPIRLGMAFLHSFCYLSTESVLLKEGVMFQSMPYITLISNQSKKFKIGDCLYVSRQMQDKFLFNNAGIIEKNDIKQAGLERAVADIIYYNPNYHFDASDLIDWKKVKKIQKEVGFNLK